MFSGSLIWKQLTSLAKYLTQTEVHTYAFSVAANAILSLFPFIVMMFTIARRVAHLSTRHKFPITGPRFDRGR